MQLLACDRGHLFDAMMSEFRMNEATEQTFEKGKKITGEARILAEALVRCGGEAGLEDALRRDDVRVIHEGGCLRHETCGCMHWRAWLCWVRT